MILHAGHKYASTSKAIVGGNARFQVTSPVRIMIDDVYAVFYGFSENSFSVSTSVRIKQKYSSSISRRLSEPLNMMIHDFSDYNDFVSRNIQMLRAVQRQVVRNAMDWCVKYHGL